MPILPKPLEKFLRIFFRYLYHQFAWTYDLVAAMVSGGRWNTWVRTALPYLEGSSRSLELGYGTGHLLQACAESGAWVVGLDASRQMGRLARKRLDRSGQVAGVTSGYAQNMPFPDGAFDKVAATFPTEYILDRQTLSEVRRVLKPGGSLIILPAAWIEGGSIWDRFLAWLFRITAQAPDSQAAEAGRPYSERLASAGFSVQSHRVSVRSSTVLVLEAAKPE